MKDRSRLAGLQMMCKSIAWMLGMGVIVLNGCAQDSALDAPPARVDEPIGVQMMRVQPQLRNQRFSNLLSFETPDDAVFVSGASPDALSIDGTRAHTGRSSLRVSGGVLAIKLSPLVSANTFPGEWTLAGAYFYSTSASTITVGCQLGGALVAQRKVTIPAGRWTAVMLDVALLSDMRALVEPDAATSIAFQLDATEPVWCDDVLLINNSQVLFATQGSGSSLSDSWRIERRGLNYLGAAPQRFSFKLPIADYAPDGWTIEQVNLKRVQFACEGSNQRLTIYSDGRAFADGEYRPMSASAAEPQFFDQHRAPGTIELDEQLGRVNRNTAGDANNDGYNESLGAYQLHCHGARLQFTIAPGKTPLVQPVIEITGMPAGQLLVTIEGRMIDDVTRLADGTVLIELPGKITRPTGLSVHVQ